MEELNQILSLLPIPSLSPELKQLLLNQSLVPDANGKLPKSDGYQPTYDVWFAAWQAFRLATAEPEIVSASSENTAIQMKPRDISAWLDMLAMNSLILKSQTGDHITPIPIHNIDEKRNWYAAL